MVRGKTKAFKDFLRGGENQISTLNNKHNNDLYVLIMRNKYIT